MGRQFGCQTGIELAFDGWAVAAQVSQGDPPSHGRSTISTYRDFDKFKKMDAKRITPGWTELAEKTGLDPLGMQNASTVLYQSLLPGISNVTLGSGTTDCIHGSLINTLGSLAIQIQLCGGSIFVEQRPSTRWWLSGQRLSLT